MNAKCLRCDDEFETVEEARDHAMRHHEDPDAGVKKEWLPTYDC